MICVCACENVFESMNVTVSEWVSGCMIVTEIETVCVCVFKQSSSCKHLIATTLPGKMGNTGKSNKISNVLF